MKAARYPRYSLHRIAYQGVLVVASISIGWDMLLVSCERHKIRRTVLLPVSNHQTEDIHTLYIWDDGGVGQGSVFDSRIGQFTPGWFCL